MKGRLSLLAAVGVSLLLHGALIGIGELLSGDDGASPAREEFQVQYPPSEPPAGEGSQEEKPQEEAAEPSAQRSISLETPDPVYRPYFSTLTRAIEKFWQEPVLRGEDPDEGSVVIEFTLGAEGDLRAVSVKRSSGVRGMDLAAVTAVKEAAPFEEIPPEIATGELTVQALFVYD